MAKNRVTATSAQVDAAMTTVLAAEERAREAIVRCAREADEVLAEAHQRAQIIAERTDRRITNLRLRCDRSVSDRTAAMLEKDSLHADRVDVQAEDKARITVAAARVAAELTGEVGND